MTDRTHALMQVLGQGLWNNTVPNLLSHADPASRTKLWAGVQPNRLGTLGLLRELRDTTAGSTARWDPSSRYGHLDNTQFNNLSDNFSRLLDQLHPVEHLTEAEKKVILGYQASPHEYKWDRGGTGTDDRLRSGPQRDLYDLLQASELPLDLNVYRGLTVGPLSSADRLPLFSLPREGDVLGSRGFMSTSVNPSSAWDFLSGDSGHQSYLADIYLPERTRALPIRTGGQMDNEKELLLSPGQRYRVAGEPEPFSSDFGNTHRLRLEALHPDDPYQAPEHLRGALVRPGLHDPRLDEGFDPNSLGDQTAVKQYLRLKQGETRGHYAKSGVLGYLAGLGPLAALATPSMMDLYSHGQEPQ